MGFRDRERESKFILTGADLNFICNEFDRLLRTESPVRKWGSSADHYYLVKDSSVAADFARIRERDGIRQLTVKGKDRGSNDDRLEIDLDCTSSVNRIQAFFQALLGKPLGTVSKSYYVWVMAASEHDTITAYTVDSDENLKDSVILEFEARTMDGVKRLENLVLDSLQAHDNIKIERAPGSLFEMCVTKEKAWTKT